MQIMHEFMMEDYENSYHYFNEFMIQQIIQIGPNQCFSKLLLILPHQILSIYE